MSWPTPPTSTRCNFALNHLTDSSLSRRIRTALETVSEMANWGGNLPEGHALFHGDVSGCANRRGPDYRRVGDG